MDDIEAGRHRLALNRLFRKAGVNRYAECRVCNFTNRSVIVVNATGENAKINELIYNYCSKGDATILAVDFQEPEGKPTLWALG